MLRPHRRSLTTRKSTNKALRSTPAAAAAPPPRAGTARNKRGGRRPRRSFARSLPDTAAAAAARAVQGVALVQSRQQHVIREVGRRVGRVAARAPECRVLSFLSSKGTSGARSSLYMFCGTPARQIPSRASPPILSVRPTTVMLKRFFGRRTTNFRSSTDGPARLLGHVKLQPGFAFDDSGRGRTSPGQALSGCLRKRHPLRRVLVEDRGSGDTSLITRKCRIPVDDAAAHGSMVFYLRHRSGQDHGRNVNAATVFLEGHCRMPRRPSPRSPNDSSSPSKSRRPVIQLLNDRLQNVRFSLTDASASIELRDVPAVFGM